MSAQPYATLFPTIRTKLWPPDGKPPEAWDERREGSVLKRLLIHRSVSQVEVALHGLALLRDSGQVNWLKPGAKMTSRALYNSRSGVSQMFELATAEYWRKAKRPIRQAASHVGDILFRVLRLSSEYRHYLKTPEWRERRARALIDAAHRCEACQQIGGELDVHHLTYTNFGNERPEDLQVLCRTCHKARHAPRPKPPEETMNPEPERGGAILRSLGDP